MLKDDPCRGPSGEPLDGATIFYIRTLTGYDEGFVQDQNLMVLSTTNDKGEIVQNVERRVGIFQPAYAVLRVGLIRWENLIDENDQEIKFESEIITVGSRSFTVPTWACLERLPPTVAFEVMRAIKDYDSLTKDDVSKSGAVSSPVKSSQSGSVAPAMPSAENSGAATPNSSPTRTEALDNQGEKYPPPLMVLDRRVPKFDHDILDKDMGPGVRRTPLGNGERGSMPQESRLSGKDN